VARYADPPLGERAYIAEQAQAVEISRSRGGSTLHESVCARLSVDPATSYVTWDSYRAEDGRWIVTAFHDGGSVGTWIYEVVGRSVHPVDASARALMGAGPTEVTSAAEASSAPEEASAARSNPAGDDSAPEPETESAPRPRLVSITSDPTASEQSASEQAASDPRDDAAGTSQEPEPTADATESSTSNQDALIPQSPAPKRTKRAKGKKGRASIPSWDEILFGATKDSE
jgi:hypothetical protein